MSKKRTADRISPDKVDLSDEALLGLHESFLHILEDDRKCSVIGCENDAVVEAIDPFEITRSVCVMCLPRMVVGYWSHLYETEFELKEAFGQICSSLDHTKEYIRPPEEVKTITESDLYIDKDTRSGQTSGNSLESESSDSS